MRMSLVDTHLDRHLHCEYCCINAQRDNRDVRPKQDSIYEVLGEHNAGICSELRLLKDEHLKLPIQRVTHDSIRTC
jgi:hypothetical protein